MNPHLRPVLALLGAVLLPWTAGAGPEMNPAGYAELRLYAVSTNRMAGVLERFRRTVEPLRRVHGIRTVGCWTSPGTTNGGTFAYLLTDASRAELRRKEQAFGADPRFQEGFAASTRKHGKTVDAIVALPLRADPSTSFDFTPAATNRAFELRVYTVHPGRLEAFRARWRDHAVPLYRRHGLDCLGWWTAEKPEPGAPDRVVCLLAAASPDAVQQAKAAFHDDPEWRRVERETERDGPLRDGVDSYLLTPADFSLLK